MYSSVLLSTAFFPPALYFALAAASDVVQIERWENYHKQTYRNRCFIMGANGPLILSVPVMRGSFHKVAVNDLMIDNSVRWRDNHLRGIRSSYATAPYFEYYFEYVDSVIRKPFRFLIDLNLEAFGTINEVIGISTKVIYTERFIKDGEEENDYRYSISPKVKALPDNYREIEYTQVFSSRYSFISGLSILDLLFNKGPGTLALLHESLVI